MEQEDFMLIRIRHHDNKSQETQVADAEREKRDVGSENNLIEYQLTELQCRVLSNK